MKLFSFRLVLISPATVPDAKGLLMAVVINLVVEESTSNLEKMDAFIRSAETNLAKAKAAFIRNAQTILADSVVAEVVTAVVVDLEEAA